jgi:hypothetical protein
LLREAGVQILPCIGIVEMGGAAGLLDMQGQAILEEIAQVTGGKAFFPRSAAELEDATTRIALELRHQYSVGYPQPMSAVMGSGTRLRFKLNHHAVFRP